MAPKKSNVWKYFDKRDKGFAKCKLCPKIIKTSGNTSNLNCHLKSIHKSIFKENNKEHTNVQSVSIRPEGSDEDDEVVESTESSCTASVSSLDSQIPCSSTAAGSSSSISNIDVNTSFSRILSYREGGAKSHKITNAILFMICKDYQPISIVEDEGFRNLLKTTAPLYTIPSRKQISNLLDNKYEAIFNLFKTKIATLESYSLTMDIWTEKMHSKSFLGLTIHFVDENHKIVGINLGVIELSERHTADYLVEEINNYLETWGIKHEKVTVVVSDGAQNITKAVQTIFGKNKHLHCFAHQLNLVVERALSSSNELKSLIKKVKDIVTWFKQSNNASDELRKSQHPAEIKKLVQECPTRWNSTFLMIRRFLELREVITPILCRHETAPIAISAREAAELIEIQNLLKPLEAASTEIGGEHYSTTSLVIPVIYNIHYALESITLEHDIGKVLKTSLIAECEKRFSSAEKVHILASATLLDPRFKKIYFKDPLNCAKAVHQIQDLIQDVSGATSYQNMNENPRETFLNTPRETAAIFSLWSNHQRLVSETTREVDTSTSTISELSLYLKCPVIILKENPLAWWESMSGTYTYLSKIARKLLSSVSTSVPSERLFSKAGQTITERRNRLKGKRLSALLFLQSVDKVYWETENPK